MSPSELLDQTSEESVRQSEKVVPGKNRLSSETIFEAPKFTSESVAVAQARFSLRRVLLLCCGRVGEGVTSVVALLVTALFFNLTNPMMLFPIMLVLLCYRALYAITRGPERILPVIHVRRRWTRVLADELKFSIAMLGLQYFVAAPVDRGVVSFFLLTQIVFQFGHFHLIPFGLHLAKRTQPSLATRRVLILGTGQKARQLADRLTDTVDLDAMVVGFIGGGAPRLWRYRDIPLLTERADIECVLTGQPLDAVLFAAAPSEYESLQSLLERIELHGTPVFFAPEMPSPRRGSVRPVWIAEEPALLSRLTPSDRLTLLVKGLLDRLTAAAMLIVLSPLFLITALLVKLDSPGPLFFQQIRVGRYGRLFAMYKFRSMVVTAEDLKLALTSKNEMQGPAFKMTHDPRITRFGRFIRKFSIDELPQLINILLGDMSLVGPRPALPKEVAQYADWQRRRLTVKPGLTCIWQVSGRNSIPFEEWMSLDLEYIDRWSLRLDAELLVRTVPTVLKGTGI